MTELIEPSRGHRGIAIALYDFELVKRAEPYAIFTKPWLLCGHALWQSRTGRRIVAEDSNNGYAVKMVLGLYENPKRVLRVLDFATGYFREDQHPNDLMFNDYGKFEFCGEDRKVYGYVWKGSPKSRLWERIASFNTDQLPNDHQLQQ